MKKWSVRLYNTKTNKSGYSNYCGYDTRREAEKIAEQYRALGLDAQVIKNK